jgi:hypothetical protein
LVEATWFACVSEEGGCTGFSVLSEATVVAFSGMALFRLAAFELPGTDVEVA